MTKKSIDEALRASLEDARLSRSERRAIQMLIAEHVQSDAAKDALRARAFDMAQGELLDPQSKAVVGWLEDVVRTLDARRPQQSRGRREVYFTPGDDCAMQLIRLIDQTARWADICVFTITDNRIADALLRAEQRGVSLRIITDNDKAEDRGSDVYRLHGTGIEVRVDQTPHHMHHKFAIFDRQAVVTGSYNWTRGAAEHNFENLVLLEESRLTAEFREEFEKLWKNAEPPRPA